MKLGRFVVDTHVHSQRFAPGKDSFKNAKAKGHLSYNDLAAVIATAEPYDNSDRLLFDMDCYGVDMCVLLPAFGMTNELNLALVERHPDKFVAVCSATETLQKCRDTGEPWSAKAAAEELDKLLASGKFVGIGEGLPTDHDRLTTTSQTDRLDEMRPTLEVARKHKSVVRVHSGVVMGYPLTHHFWPETLHPMWLLDIAQEYPDVPIVFDHGGVQGGASERFFEQALLVAGANDNVYLETGLWWPELYEKALRDPNVGPEKLLWGTDWGASIPFHSQPGQVPSEYAVQLRKQPPPQHQVDVWGWALRQLLRLNIVQDDLNLILGGNAARLFGLTLPLTRLFRPVGRDVVPQSGQVNNDGKGGSGDRAKLRRVIDERE